MMTSDNKQLQQSIVDLQAEQRTLREVLDSNGKRIAILTDTLKNTIDRLESLERSHAPVVNTPPSTAGPKLARIPELLQLVLLHLPMRDLLLAQGVNRTFKAVIDNSEAIQRRLFFLAEPAPQGPRETDVRINPLLADERSFSHIPLYRRKLDDRASSPVFVIGAQWNSRKLRVASCMVMESQLQPRGSGRTCWVQIALARLPGTDCYGITDKVGKSTDGSWRKMYLTQPPLQVMIEHSPGGASGSIRNDLKFGELFQWKIRRESASSDVNDPSDGEEIDAPADQGD